MTKVWGDRHALPRLSDVILGIEPSNIPCPPKSLPFQNYKKPFPVSSSIYVNSFCFTFESLIHQNCFEIDIFPQKCSCGKIL